MKTLLSALLLLLSWDQVLHNCDPSSPWLNDIGRYGYHTAMRYSIGMRTDTICDENGDCVDVVSEVYSPFTWSPWHYLTPADCSGRCTGSSPEAWEPGPGEVLIYEIKAEDQALNEDCGL